MRWFILGCSMAVLSTNVVGANLLDIVQTCSDIKLEKASISAVCTAQNGGRYKTALRLRGVNNHNGVLTLERDSSVPSLFYQTCTNATVDDFGILTAKCVDSNSRYRTSSLDIRRLLRNYNGTLVYPM